MSLTMAEAGALGFGLVIGWFLYFVNRYRTAEASFSDITTILGAVGGGAVTSLFGAGSAALFGAYGLGLAIGFFSYFLVLVVLVGVSKNFGADYFLDGRRKAVADGETIPGEVAQAKYSFDEAPAAPTVDPAMIDAAVAAAVKAALANR
jgi:predicted lipid-binding transport protein (Tim44 family)